jgi:hypothetical protein
MIEELNRRITSGLPIRIGSTDTIRGGINLSHLDKLRNYWAQHGLPTVQEIDEQFKRLKLCK